MVLKYSFLSIFVIIVIVLGSNQQGASSPSPSEECADAVLIPEFTDLEHWNIATLQYNWGSNTYRMSRKVGDGSIGSLYTAVNNRTRGKVLVKTYTHKIAAFKKDLMMLQILCGAPNIIRMVDMVRDPIYPNRPMAVLERLDATIPFHELSTVMNEREVKDYLFELLRAIIYIHDSKRNMLHRDIHPGTVVYDPTTQAVRLIDLHLMTYGHKGTRHSTSIGTRCYRAPELLLGYKKYNNKIDMWGWGTILAELIFQKSPFFEGCTEARTKSEELAMIVKVLGHDRLNDFVKKMNITSSPALTYVQTLPHVPKKHWDKFVTSSNRHLATPPALYLLEHMLRYDFNARQKSSMAQWSQYFESLRQEKGIIDGHSPG